MRRLLTPAMLLFVCAPSIDAAVLTQLAAVYKAGKAVQALIEAPGIPNSKVLAEAVQKYATEILMAEDAVSTPPEKKALAQRPYAFTEGRSEVIHPA